VRTIRERLKDSLRVDAQGRVGGRATEWFTAYRRSKRVGDAIGRSRKAFHSFRHTVNYRLQLAGVPLEVREQLVGHKSRTINAAVYGGPLKARTLLEALKCLNCNLCLFPCQARPSYERARK
jgi:integrase